MSSWDPRLRGGLLALVFAASVGPGWAQTPERTVRVPGASLSLPRGWMLSITSDQICEFATPATWPVQPAGNSASSPDGAMRLNVTAVNSVSWPDHLTTIVRAVHPTLIHEQSGRRLWCEFSEASGAIVQYVSVAGTQGICDAQIEIRSGSGTKEDVLRSVVNSIGPVSRH